MRRHLLEISDLSGSDISDLLAMAHECPQPQSLYGSTLLCAFFQESTRTRLGFMSAAAQQGATTIDMGDARRLRREPSYDQQLVLAESADLVAVRHWDPDFARELAATDRCSVVNAGAGANSHPTQALIDAYTLIDALDGRVSGLTICFVGDLLRSARSFCQLAPHLGITVAQCPYSDGSSDSQAILEERISRADVIYIQSLSRTDYASARLNDASAGPALPPGLADLIGRSNALIMHPLPRGRELPDALMHSPRSLVRRQIESGLSVRSAVLNWLLDAVSAL
jgi:aspartate carbamoyltransferase catalytic subunit